MSTNDRGPSEQKVHQEVGDLPITDAIPVGISVLAPDGTILHVNRLTLDLTAWARALTGIRLGTQVLPLSTASTNSA
jgi:hypothetical protein